MRISRFIIETVVALSASGCNDEKSAKPIGQSTSAGGTQVGTKNEGLKKITETGPKYSDLMEDSLAELSLDRGGLD